MKITKKLTATILSFFLLFVVVSCSTNTIIKGEEPKPRFIQHMLDNTTGINIVDWRYDDLLAWIWVDNFDMPGPCDYVVVLEIIDLDNDEYGGLYIINDSVLPEGTNVCEAAYEIYENYKEASDDEVRKGNGI